MADKKTYINVMLPTGVAAFAHLYAPDDKAPEGASWKPDGKCKVSLIYDSEAPLAAVKDTILKGLRGAFPGVQDDDFKLPWKTHPETSKNADLRGKVEATARTQPEKWLVPSTASKTGKAPGDKKLVDSRRNNLPLDVQVRSGDLIRVLATANLYSKTEKVKVSGKIVDETVYGANLWLNGVQLIEKRASSGAGGFEDVEGGYVAGESAPDSSGFPADHDGPNVPTDADGGNGDF